jgi:hypothetical protein
MLKAVKLRPLLLAGAVLVTLVACASVARRPVEVRTTQGPTAQELWAYRTVVQNGREPTFDERRHWDTAMEARIAEYLRQHPEAASSLDVSTFRFQRQVAVGMSKEQVLILLGPPDTVASSPLDMERLARRYWPDIKGNATEAWVYPLGWGMYFAGSRLIDITQYRPE